MQFGPSSEPLRGFNVGSSFNALSGTARRAARDLCFEISPSTSWLHGLSHKVESSTRPASSTLTGCQPKRTRIAEQLLKKTLLMSDKTRGRPAAKLKCRALKLFKRFALKFRHTLLQCACSSCRSCTSCLFLTGGTGFFLRPVLALLSLLYIMSFLDRRDRRNRNYMAGCKTSRRLGPPTGIADYSRNVKSSTCLAACPTNLQPNPWLFVLTGDTGGTHSLARLGGGGHRPPVLAPKPHCASALTALGFVFFGDKGANSVTRAPHARSDRSSEES